MSGVAPIGPSGLRAFAAPLLVFEGVELDRSGAGIRISATTMIDDSDPHLRAHFPGFTIFPGAFLIEGLRQAVALALDEALQVAEVRVVRFLAPLVPGDRIRLAATVAGGAPDLYEVQARISRGDDDTLAATMRVRFTRHAFEPSALETRHRTFLPHGHPMLLVDRVTAFERGRSVTAIKAISGAEPCYRDLPRDASPRQLVYPTSLLLESFGQTAALLWLDTPTAEVVAGDGLVILASAHSCRIEGAAYPGDVLRHTAHLEKIIGNTLVATGETWVGERRIAAIDSMIATVRSREAMALPEWTDTLHASTPT